MSETKAERVLKEIRARAVQGRSLASGANRGDWLYAAAVLAFGSWGEAIKAAGYNYDEVRERNQSPEWVLREIKALIKAGDPLIATKNVSLWTKATRHFGSWDQAVEAAGYSLAELRAEMARQQVVNQIRADVEAGLAVTTMAVLERNRHLYSRGRRAFGNWRAALAAALGDEAPQPQQPGRPKEIERHAKG